MKIEIEVDAILDAVAEMSETEQNEFIVNVAEQMKHREWPVLQDLAAQVLDGLGVTESDFKEIGREMWNLYETGPERDTAANTSYKY